MEGDHIDDIFWIFVWVAVSFFSRSFLDLVYKLIDLAFGKTDSLLQYVSIFSVAFVILFVLIRLYEIDMSRKKKEYI